MRLPFAMACVAATALAGCSTTHPVHVTPPVSWNSAVTSFSLKPLDNAALTGPEEAVRAQLLAQGWQELAEDADWQVQVAYDERPITMGLFFDETARQGQWDEAPLKISPWDRSRVRYSLQVMMETAEQGGGLHFSRSTLLARGGKSGATTEALALAVVTPFGSLH